MTLPWNHIGSAHVRQPIALARFNASGVAASRFCDKPSLKFEGLPQLLPLRRSQQSSAAGLTRYDRDGRHMGPLLAFAEGSALAPFIYTVF